MFGFDDDEKRFDNGLGATDQAAGLRRWAERQGLIGADGLPVTAPPPVSTDAVTTPPPPPVPAAPPPPVVTPPAPPVIRHTLMVVGLPDTSAYQTQRAWETLARWHQNGHRWIGNPHEWRVVALEADSPHIGILAAQQSRWALWVEGDLDSFRRAYVTLRALMSAGQIWRLLVLHPGIPSRRGFLTNLKQSAASFLGIELLLFPEYPGGDPE